MPAASEFALTPVEKDKEKEKDPKTRKARASRFESTQVLKTEVVRIEPAEKLCPHCGKEKCCIEEVKTIQLDFVPAHFIRREFIRPKLACPCGEGSVAIAPLPPRLIEKGGSGPGLLAHVVLSKFVDHLPLYRQEEQYKRLGMIQAATKGEVEVKRMSFKGTMSAFDAWSIAMVRLAGKADPCKQACMWEALLKTIAAAKVPERLGRKEPRPVKK